jgi:hypothetical protein
MNGGVAASSVTSQILMLASDAGVVEKDKLAELDLIASTVTAEMTMSVPAVPVPPDPPELPPQPTSIAHSQIGQVIVTIRGMGFFSSGIGAWAQYRAAAAARVIRLPILQRLTALSI